MFKREPERVALKLLKLWYLDGTYKEYMGTEIRMKKGVGYTVYDYQTKDWVEIHWNALKNSVFDQWYKYVTWEEYHEWEQEQNAKAYKREFNYWTA